MQELKMEHISEDDITEIQFQILKVLQEQGPLTRYDIMRIIGRLGSTVHENLVKLVQRGYIIDQIRIVEKKGRPAFYFKLKEEKTWRNYPETFAKSKNKEIEK